MSCKQKVEHNKLEEKAKEAKSYCVKNKMNTEYAILIDMSIHSGKTRFFVYDFNKALVVDSGLVCHGTCKHQYRTETPEFSNVPESYCSSIGKYKIGKRGWSSFGIHVNYKLHGLETTNSNAYDRLIVLHSWGMSDTETYPKMAPESWGCPVVSENFMKRLDERLKKTTEPTLLWIYQ